MFRALSINASKKYAVNSFYQKRCLFSFCLNENILFEKLYLEIHKETTGAIILIIIIGPFVTISSTDFMKHKNLL